MRTAFIKELVEQAKTNERIFLICGDLGYSVLEEFRDSYPNRFLNAGIAEQNMVGLAAGLALEGYQVFIYSIGNFPTLRCLEQIRYDVCYHSLDVKVIAVGAGYAYGPLGASHHTTEDIAVMRALPNMRVFSPADPIEARACVQKATQVSGPAYIRIGKAGESVLHTDPKVDVSGFPTLKSGKGTAYLCTGSIAKYVLDKLGNGEAAVYSVPQIKPMNKMALKKIASDYSQIITVEEHQKDGGFGSAVIECLHDLYQNNEIQKIPKVFRSGIENLFVSYAGSQQYLVEKNIIFPV